MKTEFRFDNVAESATWRLVVMSTAFATATC